MGKFRYSLISRYTLIICLSAAVLFSQLFRLHMHIQHDDVTTLTGHIVTVHAAPSVQDTRYDMQHNDEVPNHHPHELKVSPDRLLIKMQLLKALAFLVFVAIILLSVVQLRYFHRLSGSTRRFASRFYLVQPPLRAPPLN